MPLRKGDGSPSGRIWGRSHLNGSGAEQTGCVQSRTMGWQLRDMKLGVKCCELSLAAWKQKILPSPGEKVPLQSQMGLILLLTPKPLQLVGLSLAKPDCVTPI